jgi:hypothetical protein
LLILERFFFFENTDTFINIKLQLLLINNKKGGKCRKMRKTTLVLSLLFTLLMITLMTSCVLALRPYGANYTEEDTETAPEDPPQSHDAYAGNVTELSVTGYSTTQNWQGYFGNVSGVVQLADSNDNIMYNWTLASPEGEIYASENDSLEWTYIQCFNFTALGTYGDDTGQAGGTSLLGKNLTQIEADFNISWDDVDGVNETFSLDGHHESGESLTHDIFYTASLEFGAGECLSTHIFTDSGSAEDQKFQEVLLYEPNARVAVFTAILDEEDVSGFDNSYHDFEMMVLDAGKGTDTNPTTYYFYVEIE